MTELFQKQYHPPGTAPGTLRAPTAPEAATLAMANLRDGRWSRATPVAPEQLPIAAPDLRLHWIHVQGTPSAETLELIGARLGLHALALEDVLNTGQRPKVDRYDDLLVVMLGIPVEQASGTIAVHQLTLFMGERFVLSIVADAYEPFGEIRRRLADKAARKPDQPDELLYALIDSAVDHAFPVMDSLGEQIENLEEAILNRPDADTLQALHAIKRELIILRRQLWPTREVINQILRDHSDLLGGETRLWLRDVYDHAVQILDLVESYRDMTAGLLDVYLSSMSNQLNESMRRLAVIATIFMPLTFLAGIYGMNFEHPESPWAMPELHWYWGYPLVLAAMVLIGVAMGAWFWRRRWF